MRKDWIALSLVALIAVSCQKEELNPVTGYALDIQAANSTGKVAQLSLNEAWMKISEVELEWESETEGTETEVEIDIKREFRVDLLTGDIQPALPQAAVDPGTYEELEVKIGTEDGSSTAFWLDGTYTDSSMNAYDFTFEIISNCDLELEAEDSTFVIQQDLVTDIIVRIDLEAVLGTLDFANATLDNNGVVVISESSNSNLYEQFLATIEDMFEADDD